MKELVVAAISEASGSDEGSPATKEPANPVVGVLYVSKWYTFAACAIIQLLMGVQYCFPYVSTLNLALQIHCAE